MTDSARPPIAGNRPPTPRWVKGLGIGIGAVILLGILVIALSGGQHRPAVHTGPTTAPGQPSSVVWNTLLSRMGEPGPEDQAARGFTAS